MNKIKIGMFVDNFFPQIDGVTMVIDNYAKKLSKYAEVVVVAPSYGYFNNKKNSSHPYKIIRVKSLRVPLIGYNLATPKMDMTIKETLEAENFDIIHIHSPFAIGRLALTFAKEQNIPVVGTLHSQFKKDFIRYFKSEKLAIKLTKKLMDIYNGCDECYTVNQKMCDVFKEYGYIRNPIIIPNATDFEKLEDKLVADEIVNQKFDLDKNDTVLLFVGRINLVKNILFIVEVLRLLKKRNFKFKMLFVGDGPDMDTLAEKIDMYDLSDNVILCGEIKNRELLKKIYGRSKLFVFPSLYDTNSLVQIEAASQKIPTIFLEGAITASTVKKDVNGFIAPNDPKKFADRIMEIINNKKLYSNVSERAYKDIYKSYDKTCYKLYKRYIILVRHKR